jgi:hypothetical protein
MPQAKLIDEHKACAICMSALMLGAASVRAQSSKPLPTPEIEKWDVWAADWAPRCPGFPPAEIRD